MKTVVAANGAGFSNRVKCIVSAMRMSDDVEVQWRKSLFPAHGIVDTKLTDFFVNLKECTSTEGKTVRTTWRYEVFEEDGIPEGFSRDLEARGRAALGSLNPPQHPKGINIDWAYHDTPENVKADYLKQYNKLEINPDVLQAVDDFTTSEYVSVHLRAWERGSNRKKLFSLDKYVKLMREYDSKFFVASDTPEVIKQLKDIFGEDRILQYTPVGKPYDLFVDQLLISKGSAIIGTPWSSFTEVAWWFSGCTKEFRLA